MTLLVACSGAECAVSSDGQQFLAQELAAACLLLGFGLCIACVSGWILGMEGRQVQGSCGPRAGPCCYRRCLLRPRDAGARLWAASCFRSVLVPVRGPGVRGTLRSCRRRSSIIIATLFVSLVVCFVSLVVSSKYAGLTNVSGSGVAADAGSSAGRGRGRRSRATPVRPGSACAPRINFAHGTNRGGSGRVGAAGPNTGGMPPSCGVGLYYWFASDRHCGAGQLGAGRLRKAEDSPRLQKDPICV